MVAILSMWRSFARDQRGATAVEYGLIVSLIVIAMSAGLASLGGGSSGMWTDIKDAVIAAM